MPDTIGRYRVTRTLGEGGMGIVYAAHDDRLDRSVAVKVIRDPAGDPRARDRFWREARAAASLSHPAICQLFEIGEADGQLFIAMELLDGEPLTRRIERGPLPVPEAVRVTLAVLEALQALHARGLVHRDLKPSNIFLTAHGVKLLDFGLARRAAEPDEHTMDALTLPGTIVGTPHYMAPELARGEAADGRADLFALGAILFEMLSGRRAFSGSSVLDVLHAVLHERPPALTGSPAVVAVDRVVHRALAKRPDERFPSAGAMAEDLRQTLLLTESGETSRARPMVRLIVLPFRLLRADAEIDFLSFSLPDAIAASLSGLESLVVRSSLAAARYAADAVDLKELAAEAEVDLVVTGTLLRGGEQLRVGAQLLEAPTGTMMWSEALQVRLGDIFQLQDELVQRIVGSLRVPLTTRERRQIAGQDVPASPGAYEFYLRANQLGTQEESWEVARDLYLRCLEEDPRYAPAWARLGRLYRVLGKYGRDQHSDLPARAEAAFQRALDINPGLTMAHNYYAQLEVELGRAEQALQRLLGRAERSGADPELFAGLVHVCRYCGLLEASVAAHEQALRLDPHVSTSLTHTLIMLGDYAKAMEEAGRAGEPMVGLSLALLGRAEEALRISRQEEARIGNEIMRQFIAVLRTLLEGREQESLEAMRALRQSGFRDPEGHFYLALFLARMGRIGEAQEALERIVAAGFFCVPAFTRNAWLDPVRTEAWFQRLLRQAEARHREAAVTFIRAGGERILGVGVGL
jgi:eukaryotic-like serine/threonine-protein kinase